MRVKIELDVDNIVQETGNYGGNKHGRCIACNANGYLIDFPYGVPVSQKENVLFTMLIHRTTCPMNEILDEKGKLKENP